MTTPLPTVRLCATEPITAYALARKGGVWLGAARSWIQTRFMNGDSVTWGSHDVLQPRFGPITVADIEEVAALAAAGALNEQAEKLARTNRIENVINDPRKQDGADNGVGSTGGSALVRAATKRRRLAQAVNEADGEYGRLLEDRYGWKGEKLDNELVEVIDYGGGAQRITLAWIDEQMAKIGLTPLSPNTQGLTPRAKPEGCQ